MTRRIWHCIKSHLRPYSTHPFNYAYKLQGLGATDCEQPLISVRQTSKYRKIHRHAQDFEKTQQGNVFHPIFYHRYLQKLEPYLPFPLGNFDFNAFHAIMKPKILSPMVVLDRRIGPCCDYTRNISNPKFPSKLHCKAVGDSASM